MIRRWRFQLVGLVVALLTVSVTVVPRPAMATTPAPAATGWYVTDQAGAGGIELLQIRRDTPRARGWVARMPRSGLHRLRTVMASEQLVGGRRDLVTDLCARVHCHAAINGDRWEVHGHDAGRLAGAVAIAGELIATQPRPPSGRAAHLLVGADGSMDGTIAFQLPIEPEVSVGESVLPVEVNRQPTPERMSVIDRRYSTETRTPPETVEYLFSATGPDAEQVLTPMQRRTGSGPIPPAALVLAANGADAVARADEWWAEALLAEQATYRSGLGNLREVIGGSPLLLDGALYGFPDGDSDGRHPRSVIGWDDEDVWLVAVDGRQPDWSTGLTLIESAQLLRWLGATDALNLDGGASSTFVGFDRLRNRPSDGRQRAVASALVLMPPENQVGSPPPARSLDPACPPDRTPANPFPDATGSVHTGAIACMGWWTLTTGTADGTYEPLRSVRRDQMAAFLARYLSQAGVTLPPAPPDAFPDDDGSVHEPWIDALAAMGVIGGRADGTFLPGGPVTRGQMATFLARAVPHATGQALPRTTDFFADDSGDVHEASINGLAESRIAGGTADGRYRSADPVRRDQMASFLARALSAAVEAGTTAPPG